MIITEVKIQLINPNDGQIGFASLVINNAFYLGCIGIHRRPSGGYRLTFPKKDGFDVYHPINRHTGQEIEDAIIKKFESVMKGVNHDRYDCDKYPYGEF